MCSYQSTQSFPGLLPSCLTRLISWWLFTMRKNREQTGTSGSSQEPQIFELPEAVGDMGEGGSCFCVHSLAGTLNMFLYIFRTPRYHTYLFVIFANFEAKKIAYVASIYSHSVWTYKPGAWYFWYNHSRKKKEGRVWGHQLIFLAGARTVRSVAAGYFGGYSQSQHIELLHERIPEGKAEKPEVQSSSQLPSLPKTASEKNWEAFKWLTEERDKSQEPDLQAGMGLVPLTGKGTKAQM